MSIKSAGTNCVLVRAQDSYTGKQQLTFSAGISAESAGATGLCMHLVTIPPGAKATGHLHEGHETALYILSGSGEMRYGEGLKEVMEFKAGDFLYIPAGMPHLPYNPSETEVCTAVVARTDPNEQESVVLLAEGD